MNKTIALALLGAVSLCGAASLGAQVQGQGAITGNVVQANGVISGTVKSSSGRPVSGITLQLVDPRGRSLERVTTSRSGDFTLRPVAYDTYTLECIQKDKVIATSSVVLKAATESVTVICTSDAVAWWKKPAVVAGLVAAATAVGATAVVATNGDASGSR